MLVRRDESQIQRYGIRCLMAASGIGVVDRIEISRVESIRYILRQHGIALRVRNVTKYGSDAAERRRRPLIAISRDDAGRYRQVWSNPVIQPIVQQVTL